jgi:tetratricopeptide (TPR) repeat protein
MHNLDECYADCSFLLSKFIELEGNNQLTPQIYRLREKVCLRSMSIDALRGDLVKFREMGELLMSQQFIRADTKEKIKKDIETVLAREQEMEAKNVGDELVKRSDFGKAIVEYNKVIEQFPEAQNNVRIISNLALCEMKAENYEKAVAHCTRSIEIIEFKLNKNLSQSDKTKHNQYFKTLLIKNYFRRAQNLIKLGRTPEAESDLRSILLLDEKNEETRTLRRQLVQQREEAEATENKLLADGLLRENKHREALEKYKQALAKTDSGEKPIEHLSILLNMTICHTALDQSDDIISDCIKGLRVISKFTKSVIKLEKDRLTQEQRDKMTQLELRFYIRRGNTFLKKGQIYHAKADFEEAIKLAPDNQEIRQSLDKIAML